MTEEAKPENLAYLDFAKFDLRVGVITKAERVPKSKKLLKLEAYFGAAGTRTIVAGIGTSYDEVSVVGQRIIAVLNLAPRSIMGIESHGMLLAGHDSEGAVWLASCPAVPEGGEIG